MAVRVKQLQRQRFGIRMPDLAECMGHALQGCHVFHQFIAGLIIAFFKLSGHVSLNHVDDLLEAV